MGIDYKKKYLKYKNKYLEAKKIYGGTNSSLKRVNTFSEGTAEKLVDSSENATLLKTAISQLKNVNIKTSMIEKLLDDYDMCKNEDKAKKDKIAKMLEEEYIETFPDKEEAIAEAKSTEEKIKVIIGHAKELNGITNLQPLQEELAGKMKLGKGTSNSKLPPASAANTASAIGLACRLGSER